MTTSGTYSIYKVERDGAVCYIGVTGKGIRTATGLKFSKVQK